MCYYCHALLDMVALPGSKYAAAGDADAEVKRLMTESVVLSSAQQETEAHLQQSQQTINELQAALRTAQVLPCLQLT